MPTEIPSKQTVATPGAADSLEITVHALATDGRGIARLADGRVAFVAGALPGERVAVHTPRKHGGVFVAGLARVLEPSAERVVPPCPVYGRCGGCRLQHASAKAQTAAKEDFLLHNLRRLGRFDDSFLQRARELLVVHEAPAWGYRQRLRWHVEGEAARQGNTRESPAAAAPAAVGFRAAGHGGDGTATPALVRTRACPLGAGALRESGGLALAAAIERARARKETRPWRTEVEATLDAQGGVHVRVVPARRGHDSRRATAGDGGADANSGAHAGVLLPMPHPRLDPFLVHEESFVQPHARALFLYAPVLEEALTRYLAVHGPSLPATIEAWDLYCGSGAFSFTPFFLPNETTQGKTFRVTGVEGVERAVASARVNQERNAARFASNPSHGAKFLARDVRAFLREAKSLPHVIIADPPRDGMAESLTENLLARRCGPTLFVYVACDSASLARDLGPLLAAGFRLEGLHLFDTFGQTAHFETAAVLVAP